MDTATADRATNPSDRTNPLARVGQRIVADLPGVFAGLVAAVVSIGVAELVAGLGRSTRSPLLDVGDRVIDAVPAAVKELAISWFGTNDKVALLVGMGVTLALVAATVGVVTFRGHPRWGVAGILAFGLVGTVAVLAARDPRPVIALVPSLVGAAAGAGTLILLWRVAASPGSAGEGPDSDGEAASGEGVAGTAHQLPSRRTFVLATASFAVAGAAAGALGRQLGSRFSAAMSRAAVVLPRALRPLPKAPSAISVGVGEIAPFFTPNADFYRIDTALTVPQVDLETWRLRVGGMVEKPLELDFDQLLALEMVESDITMTCVSNEVGGSLVGTARWLGTRLDDLLDMAGPNTDADQVVGRSVDGYTCGFPVSALDGRDALVAIGMNGEPLPLEHGFPARLIVPGLYGYVSATKWLTEIELTRFDQFDQYWVPRGWDAEAPIKTSSRIDTPKGLSTVAAGPVMVGGVAWAQTRGIDAVEVSIDNGPWQEADLAEELVDVTWRQWTLRWEATAGRHTLTVRAIDRTGAIQTPDRSEPMPNGATGHHQIVVLVDP